MYFFLCVALLRAFLSSRDAWRDERLVNSIAECCLHPNKKVALAATNFLLGNCKPLACDGDDSSSEEDAEKGAPKQVIGSKKTKSKAKRFEREKEAKKRQDERREKRQNGGDTMIIRWNVLCCFHLSFNRLYRSSVVINFTGLGILDSLYNPAQFAEGLFGKEAGIIEYYLYLHPSHVIPPVF